MKQFQHPSVGKRPGASKKDLEEQKRKLEEQAAAEAFEEYVNCFQETSTSKATSKVWVKAGTYEAGKNYQDSNENGKLYKPTSRFEKDPTQGCTPSVVEEEFSRRPEKPGSKKKTSEKKKSNLEIFKDELKIIQEEREERHRLRKVLGVHQEFVKLPPKPGDDLRAELSLDLDDCRTGSLADGDPNTTNLYLGNLSLKVTEQYLMELFGKFGPLASIKVMWPRTDEEKSRNRLSGFVAFMCRRDGERALNHFNGKDLLGSEIKLGWGKAVPIPAYPIYIPPAMLELMLPPPLSGLPFNAQPDENDKDKLPQPGTPYPTDRKGKEDLNRILKNATVKVVAPTDRTLVALIHRMVEFVVREGPMFEAMIMNREIGNPQYRFLFENQSPAHVYYRWKLYSILQGDMVSNWRTEDFRMFVGGSVWRPPKLNPFAYGMPEELIPQEDRQVQVVEGSLSKAQRRRFERMLREITPDRLKVAEVMIFCIEHSDSTGEISLCLKESLCGKETTLQKRIGRLYVVSDVLHNCTVKDMNAFGYRKAFKEHLPSIFKELWYAHQGALKDVQKSSNAENFKKRVMSILNAWSEWELYSKDFLIKLQNIFLGLATVGGMQGMDLTEDGYMSGHASSDEETVKEKLNDRREKLHKSAPPRAKLPPQSAMKLVKSLQSAEPVINDEIDGVPLENDVYKDIKRNTLPVKSQPDLAKFIPSKWEELDPEEVKAQAVTTTSKWDLFEVGKDETLKEESPLPHGGGKLVGDLDQDIDGEPMDDEEGDIPHASVRESDNLNLLLGGGVEEKRRKAMRDIEVKVLAFQDELEKEGSLAGCGDLVKEYREKLIARLNYREEDHKRQSRNSSQESGGSPPRSRRRRSASPSSSQLYHGREWTSSKDSMSRRRSKSPRSGVGDDGKRRKNKRRTGKEKKRKGRSDTDSEEDRRRER